MNVFIPLCIGFAVLFLGAGFYAFFISRQLGVDNTRQTPACRLNDGRDYVPSPTHVVFAHHFSTIAGAGPIVGPALALAYGWAPTFFWILLGCVLFGAVHDMTSMFVSMREDGRSMADMSRRSLGGAGYLLFLAFLIMILTLINAIFLNLSCKALTASYPAAMLHLTPDHSLIRLYTNEAGVLMGRIGGIATTSVFLITLGAPLIGWMIHRRSCSVLQAYLMASALCLISVIAGFRWPIFLDEEPWRYVMAAYIFCACWLPVWLVMQPRDFANAQILYVGIAIMFCGLLYLGLSGRTIEAAAFSIAEGTRLTGGPIWPFLFITVACGAISGFHSLAATGTTVKQIRSEQDCRRVGYNAMILEGILALMALLLLSTALPRSEFLNIVYPASKGGNPILAFSVAIGYLMHDMTGLPIALGCVLGILVLEGFVITTLDTAVRLCRYMLEEFWRFLLGAATPRILLNPLFNTLLSIGLMLFFALNSTIMSAWKIFGAGNQLIGALAMTVVTVWLLQRGRRYWYTLIPALAMAVTTLATLFLSLKNNIAPAGSNTWLLPGQAPLVFATALMLILSICVLALAARRFIAARPQPVPTT